MTITGAVRHPAESIRLREVHQSMKEVIQVQRQAEVILPPGAAVMTAIIGATLHRPEAIPQPEAHQSMKEVIRALRLQGAILHQGAVHPVWKGQLQPLLGVPCLRQRLLYKEV